MSLPQVRLMKTLDTTNISGFVSEFILLGFPCRRDIQILLFVFFFFIYLLTLLGNTSIICAVWSSRKLHTPMYILLANFSFLEICYVSSDVPKMLANIISQNKSISYLGCLLQFYFLFSMCAAECFFLSVMSFDRFLAICRPLHYPNIMTHRLCAQLVVFCWVGGFLWLLTPLTLISQVTFCGPNTIDHFLCDLAPLLALSCSPVAGITLVCGIISSLIIFLTFLYILGTYLCVLSVVLRVPSGSGRLSLLVPPTLLWCLCSMVQSWWCMLAQVLGTILGRRNLWPCSMFWQLHSLIPLSIISGTKIWRMH